jgi:uncharacterized protein YxjI
MRSHPKKAMITPLRDRFSIRVDDGEDMEAKGKRRQPRVQDRARRGQGGRGLEALVPDPRHLRTEVAPDQNDAHILAVTVCIDQMTRD